MFLSTVSTQRLDLSPSTVARSVLELVTRKREDLAGAVVAPPVRASAPMSLMFSAELSARMRPSGIGHVAHILQV